MKTEPLKKEKEETAHTQAGRERERTQLENFILQGL